MFLTNEFLRAATSLLVVQGVPKTEVTVERGFHSGAGAGVGEGAGSPAPSPWPLNSLSSLPHSRWNPLERPSLAWCGPPLPGHWGAWCRRWQDQSCSCSASCSTYSLERSPLFPPSLLPPVRRSARAALLRRLLLLLPLWKLVTLCVPLLEEEEHVTLAWWLPCESGCSGMSALAESCTSPDTLRWQQLGVDSCTWSHYCVTGELVYLVR